MHPVERLRYVAQAGGSDPALLAREAAYALAQVAEEDEPGLVPACRRLIERHLSAGPLWWLAARALADPDPGPAARRAAEELDDDPTDRILARALPEDIAVLVIGWPDMAGAALRRRGDLEALVVEGDGDGRALARRLRESGSEVSLVPDSGIASAAVVSDLVLLEAHAAGPGGILANRGSHAAAAVAQSAGVPVWVVAGVGRVLPAAMWDAMLSRIDEEGDEPWDRAVEVVPAALLTAVVGPDGQGDGLAALSVPTCLVAPELLRPTG
jgi:Initiation factor 2 subunit family